MKVSFFASILLHYIYKNPTLHFCFLFSQESFSFLTNIYLSLALSALSMCLLSILHFHSVVLFESFANDYNITHV